jgi:hypothetical protein
MEALITLTVLGMIAWCCYKSGKQTGSRKGYHAGRRHAKRNRYL